MSRPRGGLGRGLGALIPTAPSVITEVEDPPRQPSDASSTQGVQRSPNGAGLQGRGDRPSDMFFERTDALPESDHVDDSPDADTKHTAPTVDGALDEVPNSHDAPHRPAATSGTPDIPPERNGPAGDRAAQEAGGVTDTAVPATSPGAALHELPIASIRANARQPRAAFDDDALAELTHSIREFGLLQPVVVRPSADGFELVMGERRLRAAAAAGLSVIPAIVRNTHDDAMLRDALLENIHRAQLNPLEEAAAYQQLLEEFGVTHEELAQRLGRSRSLVSNTVRLMNLSLPVQRRVAAGVLSAGHARALLGLDDVPSQDDLAARIVAEGISVRATEELVSLANRGGATRPARRRPVRSYPAPAVADLADKLSDVFDTRVRVDIGQRKGKITVEFATVADLNRIVAVMAPHVALADAVRAHARADHSDGNTDDDTAAAGIAQAY